MISRTLPVFWKLYRKLPASARQAARQAYREFAGNPGHPGLHFHRLVNRPDCWSARISGDYRAIGIRQTDGITWIWIGDHKDFDRMFPR
jgi:hypothetical protein